MNPFHGRHFQGEIILWAVRWYCKYGISYREFPWSAFSGRNHSLGCALVL
ncbi:hypothetical protein [Acinetobacter pittii]